MKRYVVAADRWAYAAWCASQGGKQNIAVHVSTPATLAGLQLEPEQVIFAPGWESNPRAKQLKAAVSAATVLRRFARL